MVEIYLIRVATLQERFISLMIIRENRVGAANRLNLKCYHLNWKQLNS